MRNKLVFLFPLLALALALSACGALPAPSTDRFISVSGNGTVYLVPDIAYLNVGVHTEDPDISLAVDRNNTRTQAVIDALLAMGVEARDIQTSNFSVWSMEDYDQSGMPYTKYVVDNTVYITARDLSNLGGLLDTVVTAGANNINSLTFDVADKTAAQAEARRLALANARSLAEQLAGEAGVSVGEVQNITYSDYNYAPYYGMGGGGAEAPNASVPIQPGQTQITVTVSVSYGIK